jgi:CRP/FNR family transcriptional regulator, dissimilatory nitrate respiration regulator
MDLLKLLNFTEFFGGLSEKSKQMLSEIAIAKELKRGDILFHEGDKGFALYLLGTGSIQLTKVTAQGKDVVIKVVRPGEVFGEVILFEQDDYPVTAVTVKKGVVFILPKHQFHCLLERESFRNDFFVFLMKKQRYLAERIRYLLSHEVDERFFMFLREHYGEKEVIVPGISKKDMAAAIGTIPETFSRLLLRLKTESIAQWEGGEIRLKEGFWSEFGKTNSR